MWLLKYSNSFIINPGCSRLTIVTVYTTDLTITIFLTRSGADTNSPNSYYYYPHVGS